MWALVSALGEDLGLTEVGGLGSPGRLAVALLGSSDRVFSSAKQDSSLIAGWMPWAGHLTSRTSPPGTRS